EIERERRLPTDVVESLRAAGVFRMMMPRDWGGPEMTMSELVEVIETIAAGDGSAGWGVAGGGDSGLCVHSLPADAARELYPDLDVITAGSIPAAGRAQAVEGGYLVQGRWPFASGITHAEVVALGCFEFGIDPNALPVWRVVALPAAEVQVLDTWY